MLTAEDLMRPRRPTLAALPGDDVSLDFLSSAARRERLEAEAKVQAAEGQQQGKQQDGDVDGA